MKIVRLQLELIIITITGLTDAQKSKPRVCSDPDEENNLKYSIPSVR